MKDLRFHYGGKRNHLAQLHADLNKRISSIRRSADLTTEEKQQHIDALKTRYARREKQLLDNLY